MGACNLLQEGRMRCLSLVAFCGLIGLPSIGSSSDSTGKHEFGLDGKAALCVPQGDLDPVLIPYNDETTDLAVGSGRTPGFGFLFSADEVVKHLKSGSFRTFPEFAEHPYVNRLSGSIGFISAPDAHRLGSAMRARNLEDEWAASGACDHVVATQLQGSDLFEVKCRAKDNYANILNRLPDRTQPLPDPNSVVVATCVYETISDGKFAGRSRRSCTRAVILDGFFVNYRIQEENMPLYRQLDEFFRDKIVEWKGNCVVGRKV